MEVHPPHQPIHSWRDFFIHLITITIGLLIALGLEGLVEQAHHHSLVKEAREDLRSEMKSNHERLAVDLTAVRADEQRLIGDVKTLLALRSGGAIKGRPVDYSSSWKSFGNSAWKTAGSSGALIYLDFETERDLEDVYSLQDDVVSASALRIQRDHALAVAPISIGLDTGQVTKEEIQLSVQRSVDLIMDLKTLEQQLVRLDERYTEELAKL